MLQSAFQYGSRVQQYNSSPLMLVNNSVGKVNYQTSPRSLSLFWHCRNHQVVFIQEMFQTHDIFLFAFMHGYQEEGSGVLQGGVEAFGSRNPGSSIHLSCTGCWTVQGHGGWTAQGLKYFQGIGGLSCPVRPCSLKVVQTTG